MKEIVIDCKNINSRYQLHEKLAESLGFPEWYGNNLDALHDCLTDISEKTEVVLENYSMLKENLDKYAALFEKVITVSTEENENLTFIMMTDE